MKTVLIFVFLFFAFGCKNLFAADAGMDVSKRITHLIQKVDELEKKHQQTLMDQDDILEQINKLKIVARK